MSALLQKLQKVSEITGIVAPYNEEAVKKAEEAKQAGVKPNTAVADTADDASDDVDQLDGDGLFTVVKAGAKKAGDEVKKAGKAVKDKVAKKTDSKTDKTGGDADANDDDSIIEAIAKAEKTGNVDASNTSGIIRSSDKDKAGNQNKEDKTMTAMRSMDFYSKVGNNIYDVDRGMEMDRDLRSWIISQFGKDQDLVKEVMKTLPSVIERNPKIIPKIKEMIKDVAESNIPYTITYLSKVDDKEYESAADAEASVADLAKRLQIKASDMLKLVYHKIDEQGNIGKRVAREEVEEFVKTFDGDRKALRRRLFLPDPDSKRSSKDNSNKGDKPKKDSSDAKATVDKAGDTK